MGRFVEMQFGFIMPVTNTIQVAPRGLPGALEKQRGSSPIRKSGQAPFQSQMTKAERVPEKMGDGVVLTPPWGRDAGPEAEEGVTSGRWQKKRIGCSVCATNNPALGSWPGGVRPPTEPALEASRWPGNHFSKAIARRTM